MPNDMWYIIRRVAVNVFDQEKLCLKISVLLRRNEGMYPQMKLVRESLAMRNVMYYLDLCNGVIEGLNKIA